MHTAARKNTPAHIQPNIRIEIVDEISSADLADLCDVTDAAIEDGGGFGWVKLPARQTLERYWKGVLAVPERHLILARLDNVICGTIQLVEPSRNNEAQSFVSTLQSAFVAPFARHYGIGRRLTETAEQLAIEMGYQVLQLDVRETQKRAIKLYADLNFRHWGTNPSYAYIDGKMIKGYHYSKNIAPLSVIK